MPITEAQRQKRRNYLGSSDAPAIVGVDHFRNIADVYFSKVKELDEEKTSDAMEVGNLCEDAVLNWFMKETGQKIRKNRNRVHANGIMAANLDAEVVGSPEGVEAKTTGITGPYEPTEWGEPHSDEVPERVIVQCQHQMAVVPEMKLVWVPVLLGGIGFRLYKIDRNDAFIKDLEDIELTFWHDNVQKEIPPEDNLPAISLLKRIRRVPNKIVQVESDVVKKWLDAKETLRLADKDKKDAEQVLLTVLGDAEAADCGLGRVTYFEQSRKEYLVAASTYRVARFKKLEEVRL